MKNFLRYLLCASSVLFSALSWADVYKCTGDGGAPTFVDSNTKANYKNCQLIMRNNGSQAASNKQQNLTPSNFPKVDKQTQNQRDEKLKTILMAELETEQKALALAKNQQTDLDIEMHQKNIQLLQKEIGALK